MRAGYGKNLRNWVDQFSIESIVDFGDLPVFEEATTYPCIWHMSKTANAELNFKATSIESLDFEVSLSEYVRENQFEVNQSLLPENGWTLVNDKIQRLLEKIKNQGTPLGEYVEGKIYRGVTTGLNEAFVIDEETKDRLIEKEPKSADFIKPFLGGRDVKRYQPLKVDKWILFIPWHFPLHEDETIIGASKEAETIFQKDYPAIWSHLNQFRTKLENRNKTETGIRYEWYALQRCAATYYQEFDKAKIVVPAIVKSANYSFDESGFYGNDKTSIISTGDKALLGIISSKAVDFFMKQIASTKQNGYFEYKPVYVSQLPIAPTDDQQKSFIESKVDQILSLKKENPQADTSALEREIDLMVYELYGLSEEEIGIVEGGVK
jgi:hypothetical protein